MKFTSVKLKGLGAALALGVSYAGIADAATITNGSLTGPVVNGGVPTGWSMLTETPDTNDINNNVGGLGSYTVAPSISSDGGTWVGIGRSIGFIETFGQTVGSFTLGSTYSLSWESANFGYETFAYTGTNAIEVLLDGVSIGTGASQPFGSSWVIQSLLFVATAASHDISFRLADSTTSYMSIDGISLSEVPSEVPIPAALPLLAAGLGALGVMGRRKNRKIAAV